LLDLRHPARAAYESSTRVWSFIIQVCVSIVNGMHVSDHACGENISSNINFGVSLFWTDSEMLI